MTETRYPGHEALGPFFALIMGAIGEAVDGDHFFDIFTDDMAWEYGFALPGMLTRIDGRENLIRHFSGYGDILWLDSMSGLVTHRTPDGLVLEYASHGRGVQTGRPYNNHYVSIIKIKNRKVVNWRDYSNKLAVLDAVGGADAVAKAMNVSSAGAA